MIITKFKRVLRQELLYQLPAPHLRHRGAIGAIAHYHNTRFGNRKAIGCGVRWECAQLTFGR